MKLHTFCTRLWGRYPNIWIQDIDRLGHEKIWRTLAEKTGTELARAYQTTLNAYEGVLYERHVQRGVSKWLMPIGLYHRTRRLYGQQFCPSCLSSDEQPYFRRQWRLAFVVVCTRHGNLLWDRCPGCNHAISFHENDYGTWELEEVCPMTRCPSCRLDWKQAPSPDVLVPEPLKRLQQILLNVLHVGFGNVGLQSFHRMLVFDGMHVLLRAIQSDSHAGRLRRHLHRQSGHFEFEVGDKTNRRNFEYLNVFDRAYLMNLVCGILERWPHTFVEACRNANLTSSYFFNYQNSVPYWLFSVIDWHLNETWYQPSDEEIRSCIAFLKKRTGSATPNAVALTLGRYPSPRYYRFQVD